MRVIVIVKASKESEAGVMPDEKLLAEMGKYNEELVKAGIMLAGEGLHPSFEGQARPILRRQAHRRRRAVRGDQGARRRLLAVAGQVDGRGRRVGAKRCPNPSRRGVRGGAPAGLRGRRLRRGVHAGAARTGTAASRPDRGATEVARPRESRQLLFSYPRFLFLHAGLLHDRLRRLEPQPGRVLRGHVLGNAPEGFGTDAVLIPIFFSAWRKPTRLTMPSPGISRWLSSTSAGGRSCASER